MPWAGNTAKTTMLNGKQFTVTREMLTAVACHFLNKVMICFPMNLNVSLDFISGNIEILRKQNSLFLLGPVIKC